MRVFLDTVGCRLNQAEIEAIARQFRLAGHEIVAGPEGADLAVVNTCAVTARAASDSRSAIRRIARLGQARIVATGCWVTLEPAAAARLPHVHRLIDNAQKDRLVDRVLDQPPADFDLEPLARQRLPGSHGRTRAFIKVQDGCDNHCTFCVTTVARGPARSRPLIAVLADIDAALAGGAREIVLTGVHLGSWGHDFGSHLAVLVRAILVQTDVPRLRLSSLEPWDLSAEFFALWEEPRLCPHLHLPLQSGCPSTLRRMARRTTPRSFSDLVDAARRTVPDIAVTTDVIAGFPGETEAEFRESLDFVRSMQFAGGHAFTYSPRPGTAASRLSDPVPPHVKHERNRLYRQLFEAQALAYRRRFAGRSATVLWESQIPADGPGFRLEGLTANYLRVTSASPEPRWNRFDLVDLTEVSGPGLDGVIRKT